MTTFDKKKINLLVHLAKIDGKFDRSERALLTEFMKDKGWNEAYIEEAAKHVEPNTDWLLHAPGKIELFYWVLRIINADGRLDPSEIRFAKALAIKLGLKIEAVDEFAGKDIPTLHEFEIRLRRFC